MNRKSIKNKPGISGPVIAVSISLIVVIGLVAGLIIWYPTFSENKAGTPEQDTRIPAVQQRKKPVDLYFSDENQDRLIAEQRIVSYSDDPAQNGRALIQALIDGPRERGFRTLPETTVLSAIHVTEDRTAWLDFAPEIRDDHPGGTQSELLTIFSIVNSLILNIPEIDTVRMLIGGEESLTLAGHIDLRHPFKAQMMMIK